MGLVESRSESKAFQAGNGEQKLRRRHPVIIRGVTLTTKAKESGHPDDNFVLVRDSEPDQSSLNRELAYANQGEKYIPRKLARGLSARRAIRHRKGRDKAARSEPGTYDPLGEPTEIE